MLNHVLESVQQQFAWEGVIERDSKWAYADQGSYKMALRMMKNKHEDFTEQAKDLREIILQDFSDQTLFDNFVKSINGEEIDIDDWLSELEGDLIEQE